MVPWQKPNNAERQPATPGDPLGPIGPVPCFLRPSSGSLSLGPQAEAGIQHLGSALKEDMISKCPVVWIAEDIWTAEVSASE